jgi:hypothetical protein
MGKHSKQQGRRTAQRRTIATLNWWTPPAQRTG